MPPSIRIFHDDTMKSFFRRMCFTPDGNLLLTPCKFGLVLFKVNRKILFIFRDSSGKDIQFI
jgi:hypothetical protein